MNDPAEIPTDLSSDAIGERLETAFGASGWILGRNEETPHHATLLYRPRARSPSYDLAGMASVSERNLIHTLARSYTGRIGYVADAFVEWRGHEEVITVGAGAAGHYRGTPWGEIRASLEPFGDLPSEVLDALRSDPFPDVDRMLAALVDHLYGEPIPPDGPADVALVEAYHPFDDGWLEVLEPLFLEVRRRLIDSGEVDIPGLVAFRRLTSDRGVFEAVHRPSDDLRSFFAEQSDALQVDLLPVLGPDADPAVATALEEACARTCESGVDVLVGADLALHTALHPGGVKQPVFIGW